jgi:hypothetical protein
MIAKDDLSKTGYESIRYISTIYDIHGHTLYSRMRCVLKRQPDYREYVSRRGQIIGKPIMYIKTDSPLYDLLTKNVRRVGQGSDVVIQARKARSIQIRISNNSRRSVKPMYDTNSGQMIYVDAPVYAREGI